MSNGKIQYPFAAVPNQIARGGHGAINLAVFCAILSHGNCTASVQTLAREVGCNIKSVRLAIKYWKEHAKEYDVDFRYREAKKGGTNTIEIVIHSMTTPENDPLPKTVAPPTKLGSPPLPKTVAKEEPIKKNKEEEGEDDLFFDKTEHPEEYPEPDRRLHDSNFVDFAAILKSRYPKIRAKSPCSLPNNPAMISS